MTIANCSMGCLYAEGGTDTCHCTCGGALHGLMVAPQAGVCTPSVEKRCKAGNEDGKCACACGGVNHGLYTEIEDFDDVRIVGYAA